MPLHLWSSTLPAKSEVDPLLPAISEALTEHVNALDNDRHGRLSPALLQTAGQIGLFGLSIANQYGGLGLSLRNTARVIAQIARHDRSLATCVGLHCGLGTWPLAHLGSTNLKERWLPPMARGETIAAFGATESGAGSDLAAVATHFWTENGTVRLAGEKQFVTNGRMAGIFTVLARTKAPKREYALVCVPGNAHGVEPGEEELKLGIRASSTTPVVFDDVALDRSSVLGEPGMGLRDAYDALAVGRTVLSAGCVGTARAALESTLEYVTTRRQFRRPIGEFGATRFHVSSMAARLFAMEALVDYVGAQEGHAEALATTSLAAKVFCSEGAFDVTDRAIQLHGAMGVLEETGIAILARDCRVTRIFEGANDVLLALCGTELLSQPTVAARRRVHRRRRSQSELGEADEDNLSKTGRNIAWEDADEELRVQCAALRSRLGVRLVERQDLLQCVARAHIYLMAASACLARADDAPSLAGYAASQWTDRACDELFQLGDLDRHQDHVDQLTEQLYASGGSWKWSVAEFDEPAIAKLSPAVRSAS